MIRSGDLKYYYPNALGTSDGQALTAFNAQAGSDERTVNSNSLEADDYWNDAIFEGLTGTNVANQWNHVKDFANASGAVTLATVLPGSPVLPATFHLIHMGKGGMYRSSNPIPGLSATTPTNITGADINYASFTNGLGTGTLSYTNSGNIFQWGAPGDALGAGVAVTGDGEQTLYSADDTKYLRVDVTFASLPGTDQSDSITLSQPNGRVIPNTEAFQSETGITRYIAIFIRNENLVDDMHEMHAWLEPRVSAATTTASACTIAADILTLTDASSMPERSFWLYNSDLDDCRYVRYRSGNDLYTADATGGLRDKTAQAWGIGENVICWADVDITLPTLVSDALPADLTVLTYSTPLTYDDGLDYTTFAANSLGAIIMRETVLDVVYPIDSILTQLKYKWW